MELKKGLETKAFSPCISEMGESSNGGFFELGKALWGEACLASVVFFSFFFDTPHLEGNKGWIGKGVKFWIERLVIDSAGGLSFTLWTF